MLGEVRAAFGSVWTHVGIIISAIAIFNLLSRTIRFTLADWARELLVAFRAVFHPIVDFLFGWLPFALPELWKDGVVLWFAIGGAVARTFLSLSGQVWERKTNRLWDPLGIFTKSRWRIPLGVSVAIVFWPAMLVTFYSLPVISRTVESHGYMMESTHSKAFKQHLGVYSHDLRYGFALQLFAVLLVVAAFSLINIVGL